jgi:hypothetical protein
MAGLQLAPGFHEALKARMATAFRAFSRTFLWLSF